MYIAAGQGQTTTRDKMLMSLCSFATSFRKVYTFFFMILYMYIAPGQGLTTPWGRNFNVNRNISSLLSFVAGFKNISLKSDFVQFFHDFIHVRGTVKKFVDNFNNLQTI